MVQQRWLLALLWASIGLQAKPAAASSGPACWPDWGQQFRDNITSGVEARCPFGRRLPGDVTWGRANHERAPFQNTIFICWSYVPFAVVALAVAEFLWKRGTRELQFVLFIGAIVGVNEVFLKALAQERRPVGSCNFSCGMPSGHSTMSIGFLVLMFLDAAFRVCPMDPKFLREIQLEKRLCGSRSLQTCISVMPLANSSAISNMQFVILFAVWFVILAPVPVSRIMLNDHTSTQAFVGSCIGTIEAAIWYAAMSHIARSCEGHLGWEFRPGGCKIYVLRHNYKVPTYQHLIDYVTSNGDREGAMELVSNLERIEQHCPGMSVRQLQPMPPVEAAIGRQVESDRPRR